jgi:TonB-dependent Receptor Plug Domain/CarboxypepD_reg-like domain
LKHIHTCSQLYKTFFLVVLLLIASVPSALARITGLYIVAEENKLPIPFACVYAGDLKFNQLADVNGYVNLSQMPAGIEVLTVSCIGHESKRISLSSFQDTQQKGTIYLKEKITSLEEVVIQSAGANVFKPISDFDIHLRPINNSQEVLTLVPGLIIGQHAGGGKAEQLFLRGFDMDHGTDINIAVDGMPVNMVSHAHGQGYADLHFVIPELIDKVEFNKGPYFADKGNFTTAGFVEFKTKNYLKDNFVKLEGGQFNTYRAVAGVNLLKPNADNGNRSLYVAGEGLFTQGYFDHPQDFNRFNGLLKYRQTIKSNTNFSLTLSGFSSKWNASGQIPERAIADGSIGFYGAIDSTEGGLTSRYNANIELLSTTKSGAFIKNQFYYTRYAFELYSNFTFFKIDTVNGDQIRQAESRNLMGYNGSYTKQYQLGTLKTETQTGIQARYDRVGDIELSRTKVKTIVTNNIMLGNVNELNLGGYYAQKIWLTSKLDVTAALRFDYFNNSYADKLSDSLLATHATIINPKLTFNYFLNKSVQLYFYNGRGFHSNDTRVAVRGNGKKVLPPAYGSDVGAVFKLGKKLFVQTAVWYLWLDQEFIYVGDEGVVEAGGKTQRFGVDMSLRYEIIKNLYANIDVTLAKPRTIGVPKAESYLPLAPIFTNVGGLTYRKETGFNGSLRYKYISNRPANETNSVIAEGYFIIDATINYTRKKWEVGATIQNLLNSKWKETQFDTESRLKTEAAPVSEIHFTPGTPFFVKLHATLFF